MCGEWGQGCQARAGWRHCPNSALGGPWRRTQSFVARWVMRRRVALREDDLLLTACLAAEGSLRGWRASGLLGRESCAGAVLVGLSWVKASVFFFHLHSGDELGPQSLGVTNTKCMVPTSLGDSSKCCSHPHPTSSSSIKPPGQGLQEEEEPSWFSNGCCCCDPLNLHIPTWGWMEVPCPCPSCVLAMSSVTCRGVSSHVPQFLVSYQTLPQAFRL